MRRVLAILFCILTSLSVSYAQNCNTYVFSRNQKYATCVTLPVLNSHLHWNYYTNGTGTNIVDVAFRHSGSTTSQWVAWALNINGKGMIGAQALVAVTSSDGLVQAYTSAITGYSTRLQPSSLSFEVPMIRAERVNGDVVIYATLVLPTGKTTFNQLWQVGPVFNGHLGMHKTGSNNTNAVGEVDFTTGADGGNSDGSRSHLKNTHGVLNVVSWGVMMPIGAIAARYLKAFSIGNRLWFYIHYSCQGVAVLVGVVGFATGFILGRRSTGITYTSHRGIGFTLFILGIIQATAMCLRPKPDSKYRIYWNIYHRGCGYSTLILSIIQVYTGLDILDPEKKWKDTYTGILIALGVVTVTLEALSWFVFIKRNVDKKTYSGTNGAYGADEQV